MRVVGLNIHPLKSAAGIPVERWPLVATGLRLDRRFMLVDQHGDFVTLRGTPRLVTVQPSLGQPPSAQATLVRFTTMSSTDGAEPLEVALQSALGDPITVQIWGEYLAARAISPEADAWFSRFVGRPVRLVVMGEAERRQVDLTYAQPGDTTHFADAFPLLITTTGSLAALAAELGHAVAMERFRPNVVIETDQPFIEDRWRRIRVGAIDIDILKPCGRCVGVNVEPGTGRTSKEPLASLAKLRTFEHKVLFGQNAVHRGVGTLAVGDPVEVVESVEPR